MLSQILRSHILTDDFRCEARYARTKKEKETLSGAFARSFIQIVSAQFKINLLERREIYEEARNPKMMDGSENISPAESVGILKMEFSMVPIPKVYTHV